MCQAECPENAVLCGGALCLDDGLECTPEIEDMAAGILNEISTSADLNIDIQTLVSDEYHVC